MASLYRSVDDTSPIYSVTLNDGGADGGSNSIWYITSGTPNVSEDNMQAACQAFADSLASSTSYTIVSVKRLSTGETNI